MNSVNNITALSDDIAQIYDNIICKISTSKHLSNNIDAIIDSSSDGMFITDASGKVLIVNKSFEKIADVKSEAILGKNINILARREIIYQNFTKLVSQKKEKLTLKYKSSENKILSFTGLSILDDNRKISLIINKISDITEIENLRTNLRKNNSHTDFFSRSLKMKRIIDNALIDYSEDLNTLIIGESGTGKEILARHIHSLCLQTNSPFVKIDCNFVSGNLFDRKFIGYDKSSFSGLDYKTKYSAFEEANNGTLYLDEIDALSLNSQSKLLKILKEKNIHRSGCSSPIKINCKIISSSNKDLPQLIENGQFIKELFDVINKKTIQMLPLKERKEDIIPLISLFLNELNLSYGYGKIITEKAYILLENYEWSGNIHQLKTTIENLYIITQSSIITEKQIPDFIKKSYEKNNFNLDLENKNSNTLMKDLVGKLEFELIQASFKKYNNVRDAAKSLGIDASTFVRKRSKYKAIFKI